MGRLKSRVLLFLSITLTSLQASGKEVLANPQKDLDLLAITLYHEARGEPDEGMVAVGEVILNRVRHPAWKPDTIRGIITQPKQFSFFDQIKDLRMHEYEQRKRSYRIASKLITGRYTPVVGKHSYFYYNPTYASPSWKTHKLIANVGEHRFLGSR